MKKKDGKENQQNRISSHGFDSKEAWVRRVPMKLIRGQEKAFFAHLQHVFYLFILKPHVDEDEVGRSGVEGDHLGKELAGFC